MAITQPAISRILKRRDFLAAASHGHKIVTTTLVLQGHCPRPDDVQEARVGFTVTKKVGNAVVRNRIRRRMRAAAQALMPGTAQAGWDYVLIGRLRALEEDYAIILRDMRYAIRKAAKLEAAKTDTGTDS
jgi:ribonuclease P protein component